MAANRSTTSALMGIHRARSRRQDAIERRRKIHDQIQALLTDGLHTSEEIEQSGDDAVEMGRQACLALCEEMHTMLPMELRDMIYDWIIGMPGEKELILRARNDEDCGTLVRKHITYHNHSLWLQAFSSPLSLHWWCDSYMGKAVALELVQRWYTTREFIISAGSSARLFRTFLNRDPFQQNVLPSAFIQHLTLEIFWRQYWETDKANKFLPKILKLSNKKATITFSVITSSFLSNEDFVDGVRRYLNLISPTCRKLRALGIRKVIFQTQEPKLDLTHLIDGSESAINQALDEISDTWGHDSESEYI